MGAKSCENVKVFLELLLGNYCHFIFCCTPVAGRRARKVFFPCTFRRQHRPIHTAFYGAPTQSIFGRGRRTPRSISHDLEHGSPLCWALFHLCSMCSCFPSRWSVAWHGDSAINRNCHLRVPQLLWANNSLFLSTGKKQGNRLEKATDTARGASL